MVGRLQPGRDKGHRALIGCWPAVVAKVPDARLRIVGDGPDAAELRRLANQSPARRHIVFDGLLPEDELERRYARATALAMPSRTEGFGLVYVEAMRHGLPVIGSIHDAAAEVIVDGDTGYTINLDRPAELTQRLVQLLQDQGRARYLGARGRKRWLQHFSFSAFRRRFVPLLHEFLENRPAKPRFDRLSREMATQQVKIA